MEEHALSLKLLAFCHGKIFGDEEEVGRYDVHLLQRFVRVASSLYVFFGESSAFRVFLFDLLRTSRRKIADKILLFAANAVVIWPQLVLGYRGSREPFSPLAATLRHIASTRLLQEAKNHVAPHAKPLHDLYHDWVLPLIPTPPGVNGAHFSKVSFAQNIFLQQILVDQVEKTDNLVVVTNTDIETTPHGLEYLTCLCLIGAQQAWGWVASILLESFCLKELDDLGLTIEFDEETQELGAASPPSAYAATRSSSHYRRALFLLYAIPHVIAAPPLANANDVALIATRLCHALESASRRGTGSGSGGGGSGATWEAQLVLTNVLIHLIFLESVGKTRVAKKRIVDAIFRWMEANSAALQRFCPDKLKDRLTKVLILKKAL